MRTSCMALSFSNPGFDSSALMTLDSVRAGSKTVPGTLKLAACACVKGGEGEGSRAFECTHVHDPEHAGIKGFFVHPRRAVHFKP